ncbi:ATP-dependent DNA helicase [Psychromicrobium xiongbiense]|uniref:ATP-dependent DNA helicase n=1 Tax=Psychromicrobium xiongbiense TaxID=3051184 RepID=UPI002553BD3B|nr:UvrD-helicase domain-containing protein [Psychromicrobium sp. YIM S02556]
MSAVESKGTRSPAVRQATEEQKRVIEAPLEPMLVIAGAGSGKTTTMADRVVHVVTEGLVRPDQVLGVTFTRKAAGELSAKIRAQLMQAAESDPRVAQIARSHGLEPAISTYHSYANTLVSDYGLRLGVERDAVVLGPAQSWQLAHRVVESFDGDLSQYSGALSTLVAAVLSIAGECSEHLQDPSQVQIWLTELLDRFMALPHREGKGRDAQGAADKIEAMLRDRASIAGLVERYQRAKTDQNLLDYGDLVALAARLAREIPEVAVQERSKYALVLLDEFQDTSHAQLTLFASLYGQGHAVTAVGDPHQSIYGFRGASAGQLFRFPEIFRRIDGRPAAVATLSVAWRNSLAVLDAANVMSAELNRLAASAHASSGVELKALAPRPGAPAGEVEIARFGTDEEEAAAVTESIVRRRRAEAGPTTVAVLCRTRSQFASFRDAFEARGVEYEVVGLGGLLSTPEVIDVLATMRVVVDPTRNDALFRLMTGARWRIGPRDLMALADYSKYLARRRREASPGDKATESEAGGDSGAAQDRPEDLVEGANLIEALDELPEDFWPESARPLSSEGRSRLLALRAELRRLRHGITDDVMTLLVEAERSTLIDIELAARPGRSYQRARHHLDALSDAAASFIASASRVDVNAFLSWLEVAADQEKGLEIATLEPDPYAVQLLTVHASKGLEWDEVYVPGMIEDDFPSNRARRWTNEGLPWPLRGDRDDLPVWDISGTDQKSWIASQETYKDDALVHAQEEERRLAYVAFTRARTFLMISGAAWKGTGAKPREASRFLTEVAEAPALAGVLKRGLDQEPPAENPAGAAALRAEWPYDPLAGPLIAAGEKVLRHPVPGRRRALEAAAGLVRSAMAEPVPLGRSPRWGSEAQFLLTPRPAASQSAGKPPAHLSASAVVELGIDADAVLRQLRRPVPRRPSVSARRGTAFHSWVEDHYGMAGQLDLEEAPRADEYLDELLDLDVLRDNFRNSEWATRLPAYLEVPLETTIAGIPVRGRIDAVFQDGQDWELVDWKTGHPPHGQELRQKSVQLSLYRLAWARLMGVPAERIRLAFYYVQHNATVRIENPLTEEELEQLVSQGLGLTN